MSIEVIGNKITMTRGDTLRALVGITIDGEPYTPASADAVRFALKHSTLNASQTEYKDVDPLVLKTIPTETMILELVPGDTKGLGFGRYDYDIQITFADGTVDTFISDTLSLTKEVD